MTTFTEILDRRVATAPGAPLVTFYDEATGERVELSTTTYANWVAKVAGLLQDELGLERGDTLHLDLPPHWLAPVFLGAAWSVGLVVADDEEPSAVVCGPARLEAWAPRADALAVLACALLPLGVRFPGGVPPGVHDVGVEVWAQPDAFLALDPPTGAAPALDLAGVRTTHDALWSAATAGSLLADGGRLVVAADPASPPEPTTWAEPLARGGSLVLVVGAAPDRLAQIAEAERADHHYPPRS